VQNFAVGDSIMTFETMHTCVGSSSSSSSCSPALVTAAVVLQFACCPAVCLASSRHGNEIVQHTLHMQHQLDCLVPSCRQGNMLQFTGTRQRTQGNMLQFTGTRQRTHCKKRRYKHALHCCTSAPCCPVVNSCKCLMHTCT
jgi:hypothetical protein